MALSSSGRTLRSFAAATLPVHQLWGRVGIRPGEVELALDFPALYRPGGGRFPLCFASPMSFDRCACSGRYSSDRRGAELKIQHARFERRDGKRVSVLEYRFDESELNRASLT